MHMHMYHEYESVYEYGSNAFELKILPLYYAMLCLYVNFGIVSLANFEFILACIELKFGQTTQNESN